jgi:hypothetical protein
MTQMGGPRLSARVGGGEKEGPARGRTGPGERSWAAHGRREGKSQCVAGLHSDGRKEKRVGPARLGCKGETK